MLPYGQGKHVNVVHPLIQVTYFFNDMPILAQPRDDRGIHALISQDVHTVAALTR